MDENVMSNGQIRMSLFDATLLIPTYSDRTDMGGLNGRSCMISIRDLSVAPWIFQYV